MEVIWPICCSKKATKCTASFVVRARSTQSRIDHLYADPHINGVRLFLHYGDLTDSVNLVKLLYELKPDEIYHLGAQSHVRVSFDIPEYTSDVTGVGTIRILEAMRETGIRSRFYQASSSEMFGKVQEVPQTETTPFWPRSPVRCGEGFCVLGDDKLPRELRPVREQRNPVQPRKPAARRNLCHPKNFARCRRDKARSAEGIIPRKSRRETGLGLRAGVCRRHVAHPAAWRRRRFRSGDERNAYGARICRSRLWACGSRLERIT